MEVEGARANSINFHNGDGYFYRKVRERNTSKGVVKYVRCINMLCKGSGKIVGLGTVTPLNPHLINGIPHEPDTTLIAKKRIITALKHEAQETTDKLRAVYDAQCERDPVGARLVSFTSIESTLRKRRHQVVTPISTKLGELAAAIDNLEKMTENGAIQACLATNNSKKSPSELQPQSRVKHANSYKANASRTEKLSQKLAIAGKIS